MDNIFVNFNLQDSSKDGEEKPFYESDNSQSKDEDDTKNKKSYVMDPDHRLLLRNCKPLLQSRNSAVRTVCFSVVVFSFQF